MRQRTKAKLLGFDIEVVLTDETGECTAFSAVRKSESGETYFVMQFNGLINTEVLVHECWHTMFHVLSHVDRGIHSFQELYSEVYAYVFSCFCCEMLEKVTSMRLYKRMYDDKERKDKETAQLS